MEKLSPYYYIKNGQSEEEAFLRYLWENEIYDVGLVYPIDTESAAKKSTSGSDCKNQHKEAKA